MSRPIAATNPLESSMSEAMPSMTANSPAGASGAYFDPLKPGFRSASTEDEVNSDGASDRCPCVPSAAGSTLSAPSGAGNLGESTNAIAGVMCFAPRTSRMPVRASPSLSIISKCTQRHR